ncbi:MAG: hypothetical protein JWN48_1702 [Myxococcaceae bacterium]|nr:hypothetical protein [Myxococcaceae bacterium]
MPNLDALPVTLHASIAGARWLRRAGTRSELSDDVSRGIWEKYVFLVELSATTTTMRKPLGPITKTRRRARSCST